MVQKKSSPQRKNKAPVAKEDMRVKVTFSGMEESSDTMLVAVINGSTYVGFDHDKRKKKMEKEH
eukprot:3526611-Ditylum_brightwellii.AAC.1